MTLLGNMMTLDNYKKIFDNIAEKYGKPEIERHNWLDDLYRDKESDWGFALSLGHHKYSATWQFNNGTIMTHLSGDNYKISHLVFYGLNEWDIEIEKMKKNINDF
jgi:uncharacterized protein (UPF0128 family)